MDLQKAQSACEQLSEQLMTAEAAKEKFEAEATNFREDAELARKAKEVRIFCIFFVRYAFFYWPILVENFTTAVNHIA